MKAPVSTSKLDAPDLVIKTLSNLGVDHLFHLPSNALAPFYHSLNKQKTIKPVLFKHEQAACFAAAGYALTTNRTGVCMVMNGPGVTNLISALAECHYQSIPVVVLTVDNPRQRLGIEDFHEVDSITMLKPVTKKIIQPEKIGHLQEAVSDAVITASAGRPGPVYLPIPVNLMAEAAELKKLPAAPRPARPSAAQVRQALKRIEEAHNPVIFAGSGVLRSGAEKELAEFIRLTGIPLLTSLGGRGMLPDGAPLVMGTPAYTFDVSFLNTSDLFIVLGTRLNPVNLRMGRMRLPERMVQVDTDAANPKFPKADIYIQADIREFLLLINEEIKARRTFKKHASSSLYNTYRKAYPDFIASDCESIRREPSALTSRKFLLAFSAFLEKKDALLFTDSIWIPYTHLLPRAKKPRRFFSMRSFGCLGFALPAALGASLADPKRKVISLSGDGAFLFNCQEIATAAGYRINNFMQVVLNNSGYSSLHDLASSKYPKQGAHYLWGGIDYHRFAESLGVKAITVDSCSDITTALTQAFSTKGPCLLNIITADGNNLKGAFWSK